MHFAEYTLRLAEALAKHVDLVVVVYQDNALNELGADYTARFASAGVELTALPRPRHLSGVLRNWWQLRKLVRRYRPDVIHAQEDLRDELIALLPWIDAIPFVLTVHDPRPHSGRDARRFQVSRHRVYRWLARRRADYVLTHGAYLVGLLEEDWPSLRGRVQAVAHGPLGAIGAAPVCPDTRSPHQLLFFGRIHAYKGLAAFVDMVITLRRRGVDVVGVVAGRGDDLQIHRARMENAGCFEIRDRYIPPSEVDDLFGRCHAVVLPYIDGTQSGVAALALGYARPVLATQVGAIPELVRNGVNGLLVPAGDLPALVDAASRLLTDRALHARLSEGAQTLATGPLSWAAIAVITNGAYHAVLPATASTSK